MPNLKNANMGRLSRHNEKGVVFGLDRQRKCYECKKDILVNGEWVYKRDVHGIREYFCSKKCFEKKSNYNKKALEWERKRKERIERELKGEVVDC